MMSLDAAIVAGMIMLSEADGLKRDASKKRSEIHSLVDILYIITGLNILLYNDWLKYSLYNNRICALSTSKPLNRFSSSWSHLKDNTNNERIF